MELAALLQSLQFSLPEQEKETLAQRLEQHIAFLIDNDFYRLVQLLYTVDVDEQKLKRILLQQPESDAAQIIAGLILTRQEEKARSRQLFSNVDFAEEERW